MKGYSPDTGPVSRLAGPRARRLIYVAAALAVATTAVLVLLPYVIRGAVERHLVAMGAESAEVGDVDFNPFTGALRVEEVSVSAGGAERLRLASATFDVSYLPLFSGRLHLGDVEVAGLDIKVAKGPEGLDLGGLAIRGPDGGGKAKEKGWGVGFGTLRVTESRVDYTMAGERGGGGEGGDGAGPLELSFVIDELEATALESWSPEAASKATLSGAVNGAPLAVDAEGSLSSPGGGPSIEATVEMKGLPLSVFDALAGSRVKLDDGAVGAKAALTIEAAPTAPPGPTAPGGGLLLTVRGGVTVESARIRTPRLRVRSEGFAWKGEARLGLSRGAGGPVDVSGEARATGLGLDDPDGGIAVFGFATALFDEVRYTRSGPLDIGRVEMVDLYAERLTAGTQPGDTLLTSAGLTARGVSIKGPKRFEAKGVEMSGMTLHLERRPDGRWHIIDEIKAASARRGKEKRDWSGLVVGIGDFAVTGRSAISFKDGSIDPPYDATVSIESLTLGRTVPTDELRRPFTLEGVINKYAVLKAMGTVEPFGERATLDLSGTVSALDLPPLGPYAVAGLGYDLTSGHMDADFDVKIAEGVLDGNARVTLKGVEVSPAPGGAAAELARELTVPLDAALGLLRDRDGMIRINVPVTGDMLSPRFSLAGVINKALARAATKSAIAYLKYAFQPYGTFITVASLAMRVGETAFAIRLDPVFFEPASVEIDEAAARYLDKVAGVMKERQRVRIKVCGHAVPGEADEKGPGAAPGGEDASRLKRLATERAEAVKDYLVETHGIKGDRLYVCGPGIDAAEGGAPRVELLI
ncbi:MAG: DUF748 domain-containing protein [Thermodesulfobacteriota bacterium]